MTFEVMITGDEVDLALALLRVGVVAFNHRSHMGEVIHLLREVEESHPEEAGDPSEKTFNLREEETFVLASCITIFQLILRDKTTVLLHRYGVELTEEKREKLKDRMGVITSRENYVEELSALHKKITTREKIIKRQLYISDLHFFHKSLLTEMDMRPFENVEAMNEHLIQKWNEKVTAEDEVYILGDFSMGRGKETTEILQRLSGSKHLIVGNHDLFLKERSFDRSLFASIDTYKEVKDKGRKLIVSHYPVFCYKGQYNVDKEGKPVTHMLYGHVHASHDERLINRFIYTTRNTLARVGKQEAFSPIPCSMINCFCMFSDYMPLTLDEWREKDEKRRREIWRAEGLLPPEEDEAQE